MASSSGNSNSSGSTLLQNSGSEEDLHQLMDQRKRKRMESNRESARRSRMRKQKRLDDLMAQLILLRKDNYQILTGINFITQQYLNMEAENSVLRAQIIELSQRLDSLNGILNHLNNPRISNGVYESEAFESFTNFIHPFNYAYLNQPIVVTADVFQY
ncbi:bZIP transcription factor 44-like [Hibiscus syriacus]|uniref:bZIP transcription factor 44-like n=1 Tax=Hibiscus syriacus TaxID=106335 RepID=UPI0019244B1E|nr:bZIP transcription factor 44-like [Hibiscus syriacus]